MATNAPSQADTAHDAKHPEADHSKESGSQKKDDVQKPTAEMASVHHKRVHQLLTGVLARNPILPHEKETEEEQSKKLDLLKNSHDLLLAASQVANA